MFINEASIRGSWQSFERIVTRYLVHSGFNSVRLVGQTGDKGADILASKSGKRFLIQVKHWKSKVSFDVADHTIKALRLYNAHIPVIVSYSGFTNDLLKHQRELLSKNIPMQLWDSHYLLRNAEKINKEYPKGNPAEIFEKREYQEDAISIIIKNFLDRNIRKSLIVLATGLGKTHVAAEAIRRINVTKKRRTLILAHTNEIVYQLEKAFWTYLTAEEETLVWNGYERPKIEDINRSSLVFGCLNSLATYLEGGGEVRNFDIVLIDECHHVGDEGMYSTILDVLRAGKPGGPFLIGLTATPWRSDEMNLREKFGDPSICVDLVSGLNKGFLANVDYRIYTDNINWGNLKNLKGKSFSPKQINKTLFITEWDDGVVSELKKIWFEQNSPRALVFCGTIDHAITMRDRINALGFCRAEAIYSKTKGGERLETFERNRILCDFQDGRVQMICAVDIFNEGVDVPDVNVVVFQRVTHSRRIFIQQLGRGLRISKGKEKVIVLDFVSDVRRFAAGINLQNQITKRTPQRIKLNHKVEFMRIGGKDSKSETFLRQWLDDVTAIEDANEDSSILKFPPDLRLINL